MTQLEIHPHRISAFGGLIVKGFVRDPFKTILFQMPFGGLQVVTILLTAWMTNKFKLRYPVIAYFFLLRLFFFLTSS
jgi:hypothetical protein